MKAFLFGIVLTLFVLAAVDIFFLSQGRVSFNADQPPSATEQHLAMSAVDASTERNAPEHEEPVAGRRGQFSRGRQTLLESLRGLPRTTVESRKPVWTFL